MVKRLNGWFSYVAKRTAKGAGHPVTLGMAVAIVVLWAVTGPVFGYSDTWQLVINTGTTIITFLMVFLIQHTQNRDTDAMHMKLDELIRAQRGAHNSVIALEDLPDEQLRELGDQYAKLADVARSRLRNGSRDTGSPELDLDECAKAEKIG
jgi:low affinity Fe/Cu permease